MNIHVNKSYVIIYARKPKYINTKKIHKHEPTITTDKRTFGNTIVAPTAEAIE